MVESIEKCNKKIGMRLMKVESTETDVIKNYF